MGPLPKRISCCCDISSSSSSPSSSSPSSSPSSSSRPSSSLPPISSSLISSILSSSSSKLASSSSSYSSSSETLCEGVIIKNPGQETEGTVNSTPLGTTTCPLDKNWTANGSPAVVFPWVSSTGDLNNPTRGLGCELPGITTVCADTSSGTAIVEPGGADGAEILFEATFYIPPTANLDKIAFVGQFTADNYVKAGEWKINGIDQDHIPHGAFDDSSTLGCVDFAFTKETASLVHGINTIAITVKNGWHLDGDYGGPLFLRFSMACTERSPCNDNSTTYIAIDTPGGLQWEYLSGDTCYLWCGSADEPSSPPSYEGETVTVDCSELT